MLGGSLRNNPADSRSRTFLFELLCFAGEYGRAEKHLSLLEEGSREAALGGILYRGVIEAEKTRQEMFERKTFPLSSISASENFHGQLNGKPFHSLNDSDPRIGPRLELFAAGGYMWIHLKDIASLEMDAPKRVRDLMWAPVRIKTGPSFRGQELGQVLMPVIYPLSWQHEDGAVALGQVTEWCADDSGEEAPFGQKTLLVDGEEFPLLQLRTLEISHAEG